MSPSDHEFRSDSPRIAIRGHDGLISRIGRGTIIGLVMVYRATLRPFIGGQCRYTPSCSEYMLQAVHKHGPWRGGWRGLKRLTRCHPWGSSGYDPP